MRERLIIQHHHQDSGGGVAGHRPEGVDGTTAYLAANSESRGTLAC